MWRCGRIPEEQRLRRTTRNDPPAWGLTKEDLCPGYLISLPQVIEAANAHTCWKEGQLADAYPEADRSIDGPLLASVLELNQSLAEAESEALAKLESR